MVLKGFVTEEEYEKLDSVIQAEYKEEGDGYIPNVKEVKGYGFANLAGLKKTASDERKNAKSHGDRLAGYKDDDGEYLDPDEAKEALKNKQKYLKAGKDKATVEEQVKERMKAAETNWKKQLTAKDEKIDKLTGTIKKDRVDVRSKTLIANKKGRMKILHPIIKSKMKVQENDKGELYEVLLDEGGEVMYSAKDPSKIMDLEEYLDIMKEDEETADLFEGSGMVGTGSKQSEGDRSGGKMSSDGFPRKVKFSDEETIAKYHKEIAEGKIEVVEG